MSDASKRTAYGGAGVDVGTLKAFKKLALEYAAGTLGNCPEGFRIEPLGNSVFVIWKVDRRGRKQFGIAFTMEGLGTKLLAAELWGKMDEATWAAIAQDVVAMILNDLIVCGAQPLALLMYLAAGHKKWFSNASRNKGFLEGWAKACNDLLMMYVGGETPILSGVINRKTADLGGAAIGYLQPSRFISGKIKVGDVIIFLASSGAHSNGYTLIRQMAKWLEHGYDTLIDGGQTFGEAVLQPTPLYWPHIRALLDAGIKPTRIEPITGGGLEKVGRDPRPFVYQITKLATPSALSRFLQQHAKGVGKSIGDEEFYTTFNGGQGYCVFFRPRDVARALEVLARSGVVAWQAGVVKRSPDGKRYVVVNDKALGKSFTIAL